MTLRELISKVVENPALDLYLENFQILDFEVKICETYEAESDFTITIDKFGKRITLEVY